MAFGGSALLLLRVETIVSQCYHHDLLLYFNISFFVKVRYMSGHCFCDAVIPFFKNVITVPTDLTSWLLFLKLSTTISLFQYKAFTLNLNYKYQSTVTTRYEMSKQFCILEKFKVIFKRSTHWLAVLSVKLFLGNFCRPIQVWLAQSNAENNHLSYNACACNWKRNAICICRSLPENDLP